MKNNSIRSRTRHRKKADLYLPNRPHNTEPPEIDAEFPDDDRPLMTQIEAQSEIQRIYNRFQEVLKEEWQRDDGCHGLLMLAMLDALESLIKNIHASHEEEINRPLEVQLLQLAINLMRGELWPPRCHVEQDEGDDGADLDRMKPESEAAQ